MPSARYYRGHQTSNRYPPSSAKQEDEPSSSQQLPPTQLAPPSAIDRPPGCVNRYPSPQFSVLCGLMDRLRSENASKRRESLERFMHQWRVKVGNDLYPLIRLLLPDRDRERPVYNLKEALMARCYIEVLGLDKHSEAAQRLIKWKQPVEGQREGFSGDFARVCYQEIAARSVVEEGTLSVDDVNSILDDLAKGRMKQHEYVPILRRINEQCTAVQQEWIIRIILKDLRISFKEKGVLGAFHPDAMALFNVCSDLKRVCWTLYEPEIRLEKNQTNIELFRCFLPQLCHRSPSSSLDACAKLVGAPSKQFIMEEKLDGERIQLHMRGNGAEWFYCSRKAKDYTYLYGAHVGEGSLTQYISGAFQDGVRNIILDGEMMVWDPILDKYLAFGSLKTAALDNVADQTAPRPCFKVFDILYLNGKCLTGSRLSERKRLLKSGRVFRDLDNFRGRLEFVDERLGQSGKDIRDMLESVLESKGEGIVVKRVDSTYQTNSRGADWVKVKPEYADQMGENLDLMVLGGWWGQGGRTGKISSLLCGLRVPQEDDGSGETPAFVTFAKVGSGMSYEDYDWIKNHHKDDWRPFERNNPPPWLTLGAIGVDDKPDVYINPEKSFVMEVKASEITLAAGNYGAGYTLRFPRCRFIHWDRGSRDHPSSEEHRDRDMWNCLSLDEFTALLNGPQKRYVDDEAGSTRKKRKTTTARGKVELFESFRGQKIVDTAESHIFSGLTFYIPKDSADHTKQELEALVCKHGGDFTQAQLSDNSARVISSDDKSPRVKAQIRKGNSIVKPQWIFESIKRGRPLPLVKELLVVASEVDKDTRYYNKSLEELDEMTLIRDRTGLNHADDQDQADSQAAQSSQLSETAAGSELDSASSRKRRVLDPELLEWGLGASQTTAQIPQKGDEDRSDSEGEETVDENAHDESVDEDEAAASEGEAPRAPEESVKSPTLPSTQEKALFPLLEQGKVPLDYQPMGETLDADAYDDDLIFSHLVFYMDTADNAAANGLKSSTPSSAAVNRLSHAETLLKENGGRIVTDILDPKLTHIIMDDDDSGRYVELVRKTSRPKHKHIVLPSWVTESVDEETLMNEDGHKPS